MDAKETDHSGEDAGSKQQSRPPGYRLAWISGVIVFVLSAGILVVVFSAVGRTPWPTQDRPPAGAGRFAWLFIDLLICFLAYLAGRSAFRSTLRTERQRCEEMRHRTRP